MNSMHGPFCEILDNGTYRIGYNKDNKLHGKLQRQTNDGNLITELYDDGNKVDYDVTI